MAKRTICIQSPATVRANKGSLCVYAGTSETRIPFEDIWVLIVESRECMVSTRALSELCDAGVGTMLCGKDHHPNGLLLPLGAHSRHAEIVENQLALSKPLCKQLWKKIIQAKIMNQANVLDICNVEGGEKLRALAKSVLSGDSSGRESIAASIYFSRLLPAGTRREGPYSGFLDYGYSVLRAGIARCAVSSGWLVSKGIHHHSNLNAFNLVDDFIEPFRPIVDLIVIANHIEGEINTEAKRALARIFECEVLVESRHYAVQSAIELMLDSFKDAVMAGDPSLLKLPVVTQLVVRAEEDR